MQKIDLQTQSLEQAIRVAVEALQAGGLVIYPTETSYGIAADATNPEAIQRLRNYKGNRQNKPFSIVVADKTMAENYVTLTPLAEELYESYLPGALTVISQGIEGTLAPGVMNENGSVGVRIPNHDVILELVSEFGKPVTATSANPSDEKQPYTIKDITAVLSPPQTELIQVILDAGTLADTLPTTIVDARGNSLKVLRQGEIIFTETEQFLSESPEQTMELGSNLIKKYKSFWGKTPIILALTGEMGAGKTHFTKGIATGLGITDLIKSPSYSLVHEHDFFAHGQNIRFLHVDAWRLEKETDIASLGLTEALEGNAIVALEWASQGSSLLEEWQEKATLISVQFRTGEDEFTRLLQVSAKVLT